MNQRSSLSGENQIYILSDYILHKPSGGIIKQATGFL